MMITKAFTDAVCKNRFEKFYELLVYAGVLHSYFTDEASQISILFDEVSELAYVDLSTTVFVILIVAIIKVLLIPGI